VTLLVRAPPWGRPFRHYDEGAKKAASMSLLPHPIPDVTGRHDHPDRAGEPVAQ
jgi:hypothetical protein